MKSVMEIRNILDHATGTERYHKFSPFKKFPVATDGVIELANAAECFWLLDIIGNKQINKKLDPAFQVWKLNVNLEIGSWKLCGYNDTVLIETIKGHYTNFPLEEIVLWVMDGVLLLPSEY